MTDRITLVPRPSTGGTPQPEGRVKACPPPGPNEYAGTSPNGNVRRIGSHAEAQRDLAETPYLVYCLVQSAKLFVRMVEKRWPEVA